MKVAFIGLGVMGYPMAGHLVAAGYDVTVFNRTPARAAAWCEEFGGRSASTPAGSKPCVRRIGIAGRSGRGSRCRGRRCLRR